MSYRIKYKPNLIFLLTLALPNLSYAEGKVTLTSGADYSTGNYGLSQPTDITYIPIIGKYEINNTTIKLTVPWVQIRGPGDIVGDNIPIRTRNLTRPITTQSGLGDVVVSVTQTIAQLGEAKPLVLDFTGKIKFGTASTSKHLGTGENDYAISLDGYKSISHDFTLFGDVGYKVFGDPSYVNLNNVWFSSAGATYKVSPASSLGVMANIRQATTNTSQPMREITTFATYKFNTQYKLQGYLSQGFSDSSSDWGGGVMLGLMF